MNLVLKYLIFAKTLQKLQKKDVLFFSCVWPSKKNIYCIFIQQKFKKYVLVCILALITSLLKSQELGQYLKNMKNILFSFSILDYEFIRKTYSRY
jgi:hypothetical protein